jgi:DNA-binding response OmpR family regulator
VKILIIEDSADLREPLARALVMQGYQVLAAEDGRSGIEMLQKEPEVALVLLDWTLPEMWGDTVFEQLRQLREDIKVIILCGTVQDEVARAFAARKACQFIEKPFGLVALADAIRLSLASGHSQGGCAPV